MTEDKNNKSDHKFELYELYFRTASDFHKNEHTRWHSWSLLYLSVVVSIFYSVDKINDFTTLNGIDISTEAILCLAFLGATIASLFWLLTILNISSSTNGWHGTLRDMEISKESTNPFKHQYNKVDNFEHGRHYWSSFHFIPHDNEKDNECNRYINGKSYFKFIHSVTRTLLAFATLTVLIFSSLFLWQFVQLDTICKIFDFIYEPSNISSEIILICCFIFSIVVFIVWGFVACCKDKKKRNTQQKTPDANENVSKNQLVNAESNGENEA